MTRSDLPSAHRDEAILWVVRVGDPAFDDWSAFERWLAADPAHADAYHALAADEAEMVALLAAAAPTHADPARPRGPVPRRWIGWGGAALAAACALLLGVRGHLATSVPDRVWETAPGARRTVTLADGSRATLNGGTRLREAAGGSRTAQVERGEVLFAVRHDAAHPYRVEVGGAALVDVGTVFDVVRDPAEVRVAVGEGAVDWRVAGRTLRLDAGRGLRFDPASSAVTLTRVAARGVGGWARGTMEFDGAPLSIAAADVGRALGTRVAVPAAMAARPVRGALRLDGGASEVLPRFAALLGLRAVRDGGGWRLTARRAP